MRKLFLISAMIFLVSVLVFSGSLAPRSSAKEPIVLKSISVFTAPHASWGMYDNFVKTVNKRAKGELVIKHIGGTAAIPMFEQGLAVKRGVVQMGYVFQGAYGGIVPEGVVLYFSRLPIAEEDKRGISDLLREVHAKGGLYFLGRPRDFDPKGLIYLWTKKKIQNPKQFAGMKIGTTSRRSIPNLKALGAKPAVFSFSESYSAFEKGVVAAFTGATGQIVASGMHEVAKYCIDHGVYNDGLAFVFNPDAWNKVPPHLQKLMADVLRDQQQTELDLYVKYINKNRKIAKDSGVEFIKFSPDDAKLFTDLAYSAAWDDVIKRYPKYGQRFYDLMEK